MIVHFDKEKQRIPLKIWLDNLKQIEGKAYQQAVNLTNLPFTLSHIALMPDVHSGFGVPIGTVVAAEDNIIPNAAGFDIGCGVLAVKTDRSTQDLPKGKVQRALTKISSRVKFIHRRKENNLNKYRKQIPLHLSPGRDVDKRQKNGSLGGGNHFIELQKDEEDHIWIMIHAGAGEIASQVAEYYYGLAKKHCEKAYIDLPSIELSFLPHGIKEGLDYVQAVNGCLNIAAQNREQLAEIVLKILNCKPLAKFDAPHNFVALEQHFGLEVWVHRKGAIRAELDTFVPIPGSMGNPSYIVRGLGNPESFQSCSHGAGRRLKEKAEQEITTREIIEELQNRGIEISTDEWDSLPERSHHAYKDIEQVMTMQEDLVTVDIKLTPIGVFRG